MLLCGSSCSNNIRSSSSSIRSIRRVVSSYRGKHGRKRPTVVCVDAMSRRGTISRWPSDKSGDDDDIPGRHSAARERLERAFAAAPQRTTADGIRMAMFRRMSRVYDVDLRRSPDGAQLAIEITTDSTVPERDTAAYMRKLTGIAEIVSELGVAQQLLRFIDGLPIEGLERAVTIRLV